MPRLSPLSNTEHRDLRVITRRSAQLGDDTMAVMTFPAEFRNVQAHYPIVFSKSPEGTFTPLALFGFREKQNLFLTEAGWDAHYVPLMVQRQPFFIGQSPNGKVMQIDLDSPRVSRTEGEPLFKEQGENAEYLERAGSMLATLDQGVQATGPFIAALQEHDLLESFVIDVELHDGARHRFGGFQTVQEEKLARLGAEALGKLHEKGYLQWIFMIVSSLSHFRDLIDRGNRLPAEAR
ncbi:MAG TPA: SapC family protein [Steroidobacteraceae bacterium]